MLKVALILALSIFVGTPALAQKCGDTLHRRGQQKRVVILQGEHSSPAFYARFGHFVVFFPPDVLISQMQKRVEQTNVHEDQKLLEVLSKELPLKEDFDLFTFTMSRSVYFWQIEKLVANALETGQGKLRDLLKDSDPASPEDSKIIVVTSSLNAPVVGREFCDRHGALLLTVTDEISD